MARAARKAREPKDDVEVVKEKDFGRAVRLWREDIKRATSEAATHMQDASTAYKAIKKECNIQPAAAKLVFKLADMEDAKRDDFIRCFTGLCKELKIELEPVDLVDMAEGKAPRSKPQLGLVTISTPSDGTETDLSDAASEVAALLDGVDDDAD